jgi:hypothetical protein
MFDEPINLVTFIPFQQEGWFVVSLYSKKGEYWICKIQLYVKIFDIWQFNSGRIKDSSCFIISYFIQVYHLYRPREEVSGKFG